MIELTEPQAWTVTSGFSTAILAMLGICAETLPRHVFHGRE